MSTKRQVLGTANEFDPQVSGSVGLISCPCPHELVEAHLVGTGRIHSASIGIEEVRQQHLQARDFPDPLAPRRISRPPPIWNSVS